MAEVTVEQLSRQARDLYEKGCAALERGNYDYAISMFRSCLELEPNCVRARRFLRGAQLKRAQQKGGGGLKRMLGSVKMQPALAKGRMALGKNPREAMSIAEDLLNDDPRNGSALMLLAEAAERANYPETAIYALEAYAEINPTDLKALHKLAHLLQQREKFQESLDVYERILKINPNDAEAQMGVKNATASGAMQKGGWDQAQSYRDVLADKGEAVTLEQESRVVRAEEMIENLIRETLEKLQQQPDNPKIMRTLGDLYLQGGDFDKALEYLGRVFEIEGSADPTLEAKISEVKVKRLDTLITKKKKAAQKEPSPELQAEIAQLETEKAAFLLEQARRRVEKYPTETLFRFELGELLFKTGDLDAAIPEFQKAQSNPKKRIEALNYLGQCFSKKGMFDLAADTFAKAAKEHVPMDLLKKNILYNLGLAYEAMGQKEKSVEQFKKILEVDFSYRDVAKKVEAAYKKT
jgi:tetratricopeptide (TPR) repeat protein